MEEQNESTPPDKISTNSQNPSSQEPLKYPVSVFFIIANEFCERFCYYGFRTILSLYLYEQLGYTEDMATVIYHVFVMICYFTPVIGGAIADNYWGKYNTILYLSLLYAVGTIVLSFSSIMDINMSHKALALIGLLLIGCGTGGIKPCVSSFGGDQFIIPGQEEQLEQFFSVFYFSINAGSLISTFLTPVLRQDVSCFGSDTCYPLAFAVPTVLMIVCILIFVAGRPLYTMKKPQGNVLGKVLGCIGHAVSRKVKSRNDKRKHWLDYADDSYSATLIRHTKILINIVILFLPTIVFWALYEQQGSRWTFQGNQMDGNVFGYIVEPDQMQTLNAILVLIFIPLFNRVIYPVLAKFRMCRTPLQKICTGGVLGGVAFIISGFVQLRIRATYATVPSSGYSQLRIYNTIDCPINIASNNLSLNVDLAALSTAEYYDLKPTGLDGSDNVTFTTNSSCTAYPNLSFTSTIQLIDEEISSYIVFTDNKNQLNTSLITLYGTSDVEKTTDAYGKLRVIFGGTDDVAVKIGSKEFLVEDHKSSIYELEDNKEFSVEINGEDVSKSIYVEPGAVYTMLLSRNLTSPYYILFTITSPNDVNLMWQIPQYIVISAAEIFLSITGIEFAYAQAPVSLKSVISSFWLLTDSFGNMIVLIIAGLDIFNNEAYEMFLYAGLMFAVMIIFIVLAIRYEYVTPEDLAEDDEETVGATKL